MTHRTRKNVTTLDDFLNEDFSMDCTTPTRFPVETDPEELDSLNELIDAPARPQPPTTRQPLTRTAHLQTIYPYHPDDKLRDRKLLARQPRLAKISQLLSHPARLLTARIIYDHPLILPGDFADDSFIDDPYPYYQTPLARQLTNILKCPTPARVCQSAMNTLTSLGMAVIAKTPPPTILQEMHYVTDETIFWSVNTEPHIYEFNVRLLQALYHTTKISPHI